MLATSLDASTAVLAGMLLFPATIDTLTADHGLRVEHLATSRHRAIYQAIIALHDAGDTINDVTVLAQLEADAHAGRGPWVGPDDPRQAVDDLAGPIPMVGNLAGYAAVLRAEFEWQQRSRTITAAGESVRDRDLDGFNAAIASLDQVGAGRAGDIISAEQLGQEFIDWYMSDETGAIPSPFDQLNELLAGGWLPGATTVLAAWSSMGKSVLVDQFATHTTSLDVGKTACVYTNEMVRETRTARTISRMTGVPFKRIMRKQLQGDEHQLVLQAAKRLPFPIKDCAGWSASEIAGHVRRHRWDVWVVDLVTRIPARDTADWDEISGRLTDVAVQTGTHGILVCQLNQERNKQLIKPPPVMRDLRGTGSWGNDATNVVFLHRDQEELVDVDGHPTGVAQVLADGAVRVEKSRNDQPGGFQVTFNPKRMRFESLSNFSMASVAAIV